MNFLGLAQKVALESGTVATSGQPPTVVGQDQRLRRIVGWVADAWTTIQNARGDWLWMEDEYEASLEAAKSTYVPADLHARLAAHIVRHEPWAGVSLFDPDIGGEDERPLDCVLWHDWRLRVMGASDEAQRPQLYTIDGQGRLRLYPKPDKVYTIRGTFRRTPQALTADADIPELPERHHDVIWRVALLYLAASDESEAQIPPWQLFAVTGMRALVQDQTPAFGVDGVWG